MLQSTIKPTKTEHRRSLYTVELFWDTLEWKIKTITENHERYSNNFAALQMLFPFQSGSTACSSKGSSRD